MKDPARVYRESAVRGASPIGLIVILYDEIIRSLRQGLRGMQESNVEKKTLALSHALEVIGHLQVTLNFEKGGEVAKNLCAFYNMARTKIFEANLQMDRSTLESLVTEFNSMVQAWRQADHMIGSRTPAAEDVARVSSLHQDSELHRASR